MRVTRETFGPTPAPLDWFTGLAWVEDLADLPAPSRLRVSRVNFTSGARTMWHRHPVGQVLHVTAGDGWVQRLGGPPETVSIGDTVWIEPGEWHWHGARNGTTMTHLAVQETDAAGHEADRGAPVSDDEFPT